LCTRSIPTASPGFRRVTEDNVDLNRNYVNHAGALPTNPGYDELADAICPAEWEDAPLARARTRLSLCEAAWAGGAAVRRHRRSVHSRRRRLLRRRRADLVTRGPCSKYWRSMLPGARRLALIDFHTGLALGYGEPIVTHGNGSPALPAPVNGTATASPRRPRQQYLGGRARRHLTGVEHRYGGVEVTGLAVEYARCP